MRILIDQTVNRIKREPIYAVYKKYLLDTIFQFAKAYDRNIFTMRVKANKERKTYGSLNTGYEERTVYEIIFDVTRFHTKLYKKSKNKVHIEKRDDDEKALIRPKPEHFCTTKNARFYINGNCDIYISVDYGEFEEINLTNHDLFIERLKMTLIPIEIN